MRPKFCAECGSALPRLCPACGSISPPNAKFCLECGTTLATKTASAQPEPAARVATQSASVPERRLLTVMFCDMVGSSALSTRFDPEEQREVVAALQGACAAEIKRLDGMVAQYLGDGVLAYFGYPAAHEDDAERAVRTGLAIVNGIGTAAPGVALQVRVGIASGVVVVGDLVREGVTQENAAIAYLGGRSRSPSGDSDCRAGRSSCSPRGKIGDHNGSNCLRDGRRPNRSWTGSQSEPAGSQSHGRDELKCGGRAEAIGNITRDSAHGRRVRCSHQPYHPLPSPNCKIYALWPTLRGCNSTFCMPASNKTS